MDETAVREKSSYDTSPRKGGERREMDYFLFGGPANVGKTEAIARLAHYLLNRGFQVIQNNVPSIRNPQPDFCVLLEGLNSKKQNKRIIVNSKADEKQNIDDLVIFCQNNPHGIVISSIRSECYSIRDYFLTKIEIGQKDFVMELPMASINPKSKTDFLQMCKWYKDKIDNIANTLLSNHPFYI